MTKRSGGISPALGVILMIAIFVILAAVIGTFVLGISGGLDTTREPPTVVMDGELSDDQYTLTVVDVDGPRERTDRTNVTISVDNRPVMTIRTELYPGESFSLAVPGVVERGDRVLVDRDDGPVIFDGTVR